MLNSSSSTPPSIRSKHKIAKQRAIRRRRIDTECGCTIYVHINCRDHGFTHRGNHHCASSTEWRVYLGCTKSPLFQDHTCRGSTLHEQQSLPRPDQVQPQPEESIGSPQVLPQLPSLDDISDSFWDDLFK
ncbi:transactivation protein [Cnidoscolus blistering yellow mosaic virus]|nr:transactivation protein [Cnidoscolus blistering yellow mosaic virus]